VSNSIVRLGDVLCRRGDWSQHELVHFHRLVAVMWNDGLSLDTDRGVSDEGEPWFVLCDTDSGEVFAHFARIGGRYVVCAPCVNGSLGGPVLHDLVQRFIDQCPCRRPAANSSHSKPAAG